MAGQDQSVNLGGMLSDIGGTIGSMGAPAGEVFASAIAQANRPTGDMEDPAHLTALAQWAQRNGDAESARMYTVQAREAQDKVDERANVQFAADTMEMDKSADMAASGNAAGLEQVIQQLTTQRDAARESGSMEQLRIAQGALDNAIQARSATAQKKVANEIQALTMIDQTLADESIDADVRSGVTDTRKRLLSDPKVQEGYNAMLLDKWRVQDTERRMEAQKYVDENRLDLQKALINGNDEAVEALVNNAPNASGQDSMRELVASQRDFNEQQAEIGRIRNEATYRPDYDMLDAKIAALPEGAQARAKLALKRIRSAEDARDKKNGTFATTADAERYLESLKAFDDALVAAEMQVGQQTYSRSEAEAAAIRGEIVDLENKRDNYEPSREAIRTEAKELAIEANAIIRDPLNKDRKVWDTQKFVKQAEANLRRSNTERINKRLAQLRDEPVVEDTATDQSVEDKIAEGVNRFGLTREESIAFLIEQGEITPEQAGLTETAEAETAEPTPGPVALNETTPVSQRVGDTTASAVYAGSTSPLNMLNDARTMLTPQGLGGYFASEAGMMAGRGLMNADGAEARRKLEENPYRGVN